MSQTYPNYQVQPGDRVLLAYAPANLTEHLGSYWHVDTVSSTQVSLIKTDGTRINVTYWDIDAAPSEDSPFQLRDEVKIVKGFYTSGSLYHTCKNRLVGKTGTITSYDKRDHSFLIKCPSEFEEGWFLPHCLVPINYTGSHFFHVNETVIHQGLVKTITKIKRSNLNYGQILLIDGAWTAASEVVSTK